jgi:hypothetical protein
MSPPFRPADDLNSRHRTVSCTIASTVFCTGATPARLPQWRKAAFTGRIPLPPLPEQARKAGKCSPSPTHPQAPQPTKDLILMK